MLEIPRGCGCCWGGSVRTTASRRLHQVQTEPSEHAATAGLPLGALGANMADLAVLGNLGIRSWSE